MRFILSLILAAVVALFAIQNAKVVDVNFLAYKIQVSQALIILLSAFFGAFIVFLLNLFKQFGVSREMKEQNRKIRALEQEAAQLRATNENLKIDRAALEAKYEERDRIQTISASSPIENVKVEEADRPIDPL